jgi:F-type H+-transporting ATPase subunit gamma
MQAIEELRRRTAGAADLLQVVRTMRAIAVVGVREFEVAGEGLARYESAVGQGLALALALADDTGEPTAAAGTADRARGAAPQSATTVGELGIVAMGSDHGLVGRFNETLAEYIGDLVSRSEPIRLMVLGARLAGRLGDVAPEPDAEMPMPRTANAMPVSAAEVLLQVEEWQRQGVSEVRLISNVWALPGGYSPQELHLLPIDLAAISAAHPWPSGQLPMVLGAREAVVAELLEQYLRITVARALTRSLVAENEARLAATRGAERNIGEQIDELHREYRHAYQGAETEELLDVVAGFEAITAGR